MHFAAICKKQVWRDIRLFITTYWSL